MKSRDNIKDVFLGIILCILGIIFFPVVLLFIAFESPEDSDENYYKRYPVTRKK